MALSIKKFEEARGILRTIRYEGTTRLSIAQVHAILTKVGIIENYYRKEAMKSLVYIGDIELHGDIVELVDPEKKVVKQ